MITKQEYNKAIRLVKKYREQLNKAPVKCCNCQSKNIETDPIFKCKECNCFHDKNGRQL